MKDNKVDNFEILPWNKHFEIGIAPIDEQHQKLVAILNRLATYFAKLSSAIELETVFEELSSYADYHFKCEEAIWVQYFQKDVWLVTHEETHDSFIRDMLLLKENKENLPFEDVIYELVIFLSKWLAYHILDTDKRMSLVVQGIASGLSLQEAKEYADKSMSGSMKAHIEIVLDMYSNITINTLNLMREKSLRIKAERDLHISEERWKFILDSETDSFWDLDIETSELFSLKDENSLLDVIEHKIKDHEEEIIIYPADLAQVKADFKAHLEGKTEFFSNKHRVMKKNGSLSWVLSRAKVVRRCENGKALRIVGMHTDITEKELASAIFQNSSEAMFILDINRHIISVNPAFTKITGYEQDEVLGKNPRILSSGENSTSFYREMWTSIYSKDTWRGEILNKRKNGELYLQDLKINVVKNSDGLIYHYIALFSDITQKREADDIIIQQANFDSLTQLKNRRAFKVNLDKEIHHSAQTNSSFALLFIDLDNFKDINDNFSHEIGDYLLVETASRIQENIGESDILSRFGGDEFIVLLSGVNDLPAVEERAQNIINSFNQPFEIKHDNIYISASIGISIYPTNANSASKLLTNAEQAMYLAKKSGRARFSYFSLLMQDEALQRQHLVSDLHTAVELNQFQLYYQPIVDLKNGDIKKAEALIRWNHPKKGVVSPDEFIPLAEHSGLIVQIGDWVFEESTCQTQQWNQKYQIEFQTSVNKSAVQFRSISSLDAWFEHLKKIGSSSKSVVIEITESLLMEHDALTVEKLLRFRDEGVEISLDDFGTGYSSLSYLKKLDIDYLKIDKSFVDNLSLNSQDMALCEAIIVMAHKLDIKVIAEGIETKEQGDLLSKMGCDYGQGYLFSKPVPADEFEKLFLNKDKK